MTAPTVAVTVSLSSMIGVAVEGAVIHAKLDRTEIYNEFIIADEVTGTTDASGEVVLDLFPNALPSNDPPGLGTQGSVYRVWCTSTGGRKLDVLAIIPNQACNLADVVTAEEPGAPSTGEIVGAVRYNIAQSLTTPQQVQARANIGFDAAVRAIALTGLSLASTATISASDTVLGAFGKLQAQVTANLASGVQTTGTQTITANSASPVLTLTQSGAGLALNTTGGITSSAVVTGTRLVSTIATGTAPLTVTSTTRVDNLNAQYLSGATFATPGAIGGGTPAAITGTAITATTGFIGNLTGNVTGNVTGSSGSTTGNAATATALATPRAINGVNFDGSAAITVTAAAGTLTGTALPGAVVTSSLTSVGTLTSLNSSGAVRIGATPTTNPAALLYVQSDTDNFANFGSQCNTSTAGAANIIMRKSRGTNASQTIVQSADSIGVLAMFGYDGAAYIRGAEIAAEVDGTPGTNDMPGRLRFSTTVDGAAAVTERMRIDNAGVVTIGAAPGSEVLRVTPATGVGVTGTFSVSGTSTFTGAVAIGNTVAAGVAVASTHKVTVVISGTTYYLLASNV